ncbi:7-carboxy-7-deazaguanine synthase QueE [Ktedonosporobacter rubrisoli]|uniref:7-carboxy-7-deazaguanine synthase n=1 Tax=Ktedonosporobacter rubrisoli TaxID=2509675 RepID=A0A4P6K4N2_KTERU|nr:7-carboxy-7-deazaguanine synthase QueE [Ktedonosporobacter rubrisoli]QBD83164.1 7-carboxy-7-deazaguanine synthase QueE [Ktedonosporobacter rubrisoli]
MKQAAAARLIPISEIFGPTIQGEGALIGRPTVFVRTGGCDYRCSWCDTLYAVLPQYRDEWQPMSSEAILTRVQHLSGGHPLLVTLSGGNPAMQPLAPLLEQGHAQGYTFALETQGSIAQPWFADLEVLTLSPKPPSSGQEMRWERLERCLTAACAGSGNAGPQICLKIVVFDEADYTYAREVAARYPELPLYLQAGNHTPPHLAQEIDTAGILSRLQWLMERVMADQWYEVRVLPQLHTLLWGNRRGV